jgi:hypothetical protein
VSDLATPIVMLSLHPTNEAKERETDIGQLNNRIGPFGTLYEYNLRRRRETIEDLMETILCSMWTSSAEARNWPAAISVRPINLLKVKEKTEAGEWIWRYRKASDYYLTTTQDTEVQLPPPTLVEMGS